MKTSTDNILVAFAEDLLMTRKTLTTYIEMSGYIKVVYEAINGRQMLNILEQADPLPDVCLIDVHMPVLDGLGLLRAIKSKWPQIRCLAVTADEYHPLVLKMIRSGVNGYLVKSSDPDDLIEAIRIVHNGGYYYTKVADVKTFQEAYTSKDKSDSLTPEEIEYLEYICSDLSYEQIAELMSHSATGINNIRKKLFKRFKVSSRTALALAAISEGLLSKIIPQHVKL